MWQALRKAGGTGATRVPLKASNKPSTKEGATEKAMGPPMKTPAQIAAAGRVSSM